MDIKKQPILKVFQLYNHVNHLHLNHLIFLLKFINAVRTSKARQCDSTECDLIIICHPLFTSFLRNIPKLACRYKNVYDIVIVDHFVELTYTCQRKNSACKYNSRFSFPPTLTNRPPLQTTPHYR